jgi:fatty-acyl-CoA synthase
MSYPAEDWIRHHTRFSPDKQALVDLASGRALTYGEFDARIDRAALYLRDGLGIKAGDRVAVICHNDSDVFEIQFACRRLGAIFMPLNWRLAVAELEFICNDGGPKVLIHGKEFASQSEEIQQLCGILHLVGLNNGGDSDYETGLAAATGEITDVDMELSDTWTIMYTSGTTGRPKGALMTYGMAVFNALHCAMTMSITEASKNIVFLPTFHTGGLNVYANPIFHTGGTNVVLREFDPVYFLALLSDKELHITHMFGVPTNFLMMAQAPGFAEADLSHIECLGIGGAAAPLALIEEFGAKGIKLQQGWGMTETGPLGLMLSPDKALEKIGSSGLPPMYVSLKICDETGAEVPRGESGELMIKGPTVTPGYWNQDDRRGEFFTADGWFHTGDVARQDQDGYFYIIDRTKDMYISGGENVYPAEIENVIFELDGVLENAVIGVPDEKWGEVGRACVVLKDGSNLDEDAVIGHCRDKLARFKVPKQVRFMDELPHNATGKVLKHQIPRD